MPDSEVEDTIIRPDDWAKGTAIPKIAATRAILQEWESRTGQPMPYSDVLLDVLDGWIREFMERLVDKLVDVAEKKKEPEEKKEPKDELVRNPDGYIWCEHSGLVGGYLGDTSDPEIPPPMLFKDEAAIDWAYHPMTKEEAFVKGAIVQRKIGSGEYQISELEHGAAVVLYAGGKSIIPLDLLVLSRPAPEGKR